MEILKYGARALVNNSDKKAFKCNVCGCLWVAEPDIGAFYPAILTQLKDDDLKEDAIRNRFRKIQHYKNLGIWDEETENDRPEI